MEVITVNIKGIKCDNPTCDYRDDNIIPADYSKYIDMPCPKCGASLLTKEDHEATMNLIELSTILNQLLPQPKGDEKKLSLTVEMNGTGDVKLNLKD